MRSLIILLLFSCICKVAVAQLSDDEKAVIHVAAGRGYHAHDFCYDDASIPAWVVERACDEIKEDTTLHLSASEITEALDKLHAAEYAQNWKDPIIDSAAVVENHDDKQIQTGMQFSIPVFIRNNTICFLYNIRFSICFNNDNPKYPDSWTCPRQFEVNMYVKMNNTWLKRRPWIFIANAD